MKARRQAGSMPHSIDQGKSERPAAWMGCLARRAMRTEKQKRQDAMVDGGLAAYPLHGLTHLVGTHGNVEPSAFSFTH